VNIVRFLVRPFLQERILGRVAPILYQLAGKAAVLGKSQTDQLKQAPTKFVSFLGQTSYPRKNAETISVGS
jgi:hypothetical protein